MLGKNVSSSSLVGELGLTSMLAELPHSAQRKAMKLDPKSSQELSSFLTVSAHNRGSEFCRVRGTKLVRVRA